MKKWIRVCKGEAVKQKKNYFNTPVTYIASFLWPVLNGIITYYTYKTFDIACLVRFGILSEEDLLIYIFTGLLGYNSFWLMIQSAVYVQNERQNGTIEITYMTPANRMAIIYGRAIGNIIQNIGMIVSFLVILIIMGKFSFSVSKVFLGIIILLISSVIWGDLLIHCF